jgi:hypothetical protein
MSHRKKNIAWLIAVVLAIVFVSAKWNTWFGNPPEPLYSVSQSPAQILLTWSGDAATTRDVTWQGDTLTRKAKLELTGNELLGDTIRLETLPRIIRTSGGAASYSKINIRNLNPGKSYRYRVANDEQYSKWFDFSLPGKKDSMYSFCYFGDVQDSVNGKTGEIFHRAVGSLKNPAFLVFIGDIVERPHDAYWSEWFRAGDTLLSNIPVIATPGNHEFYKGVFPKLDERWDAHFSIPQNGPANFKRSVCYWDYQDTRFISLDSNGIQGIPSALEQRNWLKKVLESTEQRCKIVLIHHSLYSTTKGHDYFYLRTFFKPLFDKYGVDLVLSGHDHVYGRAAHIASGVTGNKQGPVYIVSHTSPKFYDIGFSKVMDRMATNTAMYQLFYVSKDSITFKAYTYDGTCFDGLSILRDSKGDRFVRENSPPIDDKYLKPSERFVRKSSKKELEKYYLDLQKWKKNR